MASTPLHLVPPTYTGGTAQQSPQDTSPSGSIAGVNGTAQILLERTDIDKSLKALENVVSVLYDYAQLWQNVVSLDKKLVKAFKDAGGMKRTGSPDGVEWPNNVFHTSSLIFDSVNEVDSKYSKLVEREYESCNQELKKWLKKLKKEDKALDEYTSSANAKIKAAGQAYEKKAKKGITSSPSGPSLDAYSGLLSTLSSAVINAKHQHTLFISTRHLSTLYLFSGSVGRIADAQWMKTAELLRRASPHVGPLGEGRSYVEGGWRGGNVVELPLNLPIEESGEGTIKANAIPRETATIPVSTPMATPSSEQTPVRAPVPATTASETPSRGMMSADMLERITRELQGSLPMPEISPKPNPPNTRKEAELVKLPDSKSQEKNGTKTPIATLINEELDRPINFTNDSKPDPAEVAVTSSSGTTNTTRSGDTIASASTSAKDSSSSNSNILDSTPKPDNTKPVDKPPRVPTPPTLPRGLSGNEKALFEPSRALARTPISVADKDKKGETKPIASPPQDSPRASTSPRSPGPGSYFPSRSPPDPIIRPIPKSNTSNPTPVHSPPLPVMPQAQIPGSFPHPPTNYGGGKNIGRTISMDSTTSNGSIVAAMRDRYSAASPPPSQPMARRGDPQGQAWRGDSSRVDRGDGWRGESPGYGRDRDFIREREGGKVSDMASRFTPIEGPLPHPNPSATFNNSTFVVGGEGRYSRPPYSPNSGGPTRGLGGDANSDIGRDSLPIRTPLKRSSMDEFGASFAGVGSGRRGMETMPNPERRPGVSTTVPGGASTAYDLQLSELELQKREMELEIHRQRLQLAKERDAMIRDREYQGQGSGNEYGSVRDGYRGRNMDDDGGGGYGSGRERDDGYRSPYATLAPASYNNDWSYDYPRQPPIGTPRLNSDRSFPRHLGDERGPDISSGLGVMGLGLPPGAAPASRSRESLNMSTAGRSSMDLSSSAHAYGPASSIEGDNDRRTRGIEPRRSADAVNKSSNVASLPKGGGGGAGGKDKGTWLGKGLRRLSMPLGAGSSSGGTSA